MDQYDRHYKRNDGTVPAKDIRFHSMVVKDSYHGNHTGNKGLHGNRMHFHSSMHELRNANSHGDLTVATQFENTAEEPSKKDKSIFRKFRKNKRKRHRNTIHELQNLSLPHSDPDDFVDVTCQRADDNDVVCVKETSKNRFLQIKRRKAKLAESRKMFSSMPNIASPEHYEETYAGSVYTERFPCWKCMAHPESNVHVVFGFGLVAVDFTHIPQGYFTGTGAIRWLPQCQWSNSEGYG